MLEVLNDPRLDEKLMMADMCHWAISNRIKLLGNTTFTLKDCEYLADIVRDQSDEKVVMKGAQARITTLFMMDAIHGLIYNQYPQGVIYYFPTEKAVEDFSKTRFGPLVSDNPAIRRHLINTNSVRIKKVGATFLSLLGAKATTSIQGKKDSTAVRSTPSDYNILDEFDLFDEVMYRMTLDRLQNSKIGKEAKIGTPTIPDFGTSKAFNESNQQHRLVKCGACNEYTCITLEFPSSIKFKRDSTHEPYYPYFACIKCGKEIFVADGSWVAKYPDRRVAGWHVSHFITPNCKLGKIMTRWEHDQREGKIGEFYNGVLGLPYIAAEDRLRQSDVFACCGNDVMRTEISIVETAAGVDIGKNYHTVLIGNKIDAKRGKAVYACRVKGFDAVYDLFLKYNVKSSVVCLRPYEEEFGKFQAKCSKKNIRCFGAEYNPSHRQKTYMKIDEKAGIYTLHRTQAFDRSHAWVKAGEIEFPRRCAEMDEVAKQLCNCAKVLEETEEGDRIYRYIKLGEEHYRSALNYFQIALDDLTHWQGMGAAGYKMEPGKTYDPLTHGLE